MSANVAADAGGPSAEFSHKSLSVPAEDLVPFCGCICFITSCYLEWPELIGCAGKRVCLCFYAEFLACKMPSDGDEFWCLCSKGSFICAPIKVCCSDRIQMCCCDVRCSIPLSEEIPMLITICFFTLMYKGAAGPFKFMSAVKDL